MIEVTLEQIQVWIDCEIDDKVLDQTIRGVTIDSRNVEKDMLFVPFKGENVDGHRFVAQALTDGAGACFYERGTPIDEEVNGPIIWVDDTLTALQQLAQCYLKYVGAKVVAVTGSNGKTTTKDMVESVLKTHFKVKKTQGNYNNEIGMPLTILELDNDTEVSILEMGMSGFNEIDLLSKIAEPDIAIITNIGESHLQDLGSREGIAKAKFEITSGLKDKGLLIYDGDEPLLEPLVDTLSSVERVSIGTTESSTYQCSLKEVTHNGIRFTINSTTQFELPVLGTHNMKNAAIAIAVGQHFGLDETTIASNLRQVKLTEMRMEQHELSQAMLLINDAYNASPTSMKAAIDTLTSITQGRKFLVLGDMLDLGVDSKAMHASIGRYTRAKGIYGVLTYGEAAAEISKAATDFVEEAMHFNDKSELVSALKARLAPHDVILVKGSRGMRLEEVVTQLQSIYA